ncbi:MAG: 2-oxo acid dehydrogenase subunit E2 [Candidatus Nanopelagicales bacterium]|jgi:pyruvate dehydrogenase E2 component (dihydrolipoamide acetyltransferase)|nr:2-oxo acid dehydrogenase subunit E2 [Candidatus Nanopelagicales bacterium]
MGEFRMPSLGADMDVGTIVEWLVKPGDAVRRGQIVAVVDTAKAAIEIEAFEEGVVTEILVGTGVQVPVGTPLAMIGAATAAVSSTPSPERTESMTLPVEAPRTRHPRRPSTPTGPSAPPPHPRATPPVRHLAHQLGVDLEAVHGTGPDGHITHDDVVRAAPAPSPAPAPTPAHLVRIPELSGTSNPDEDAGGPRDSGRGGAGEAAGGRAGGGAGERLRVTPRARRIAAERGVDLAQAAATGAAGAVLAADVERAAAAAAERGPAAGSRAPATGPAAGAQRGADASGAGLVIHAGSVASSVGNLHGSPGGAEVTSTGTTRAHAAAGSAAQADRKAAMRTAIATLMSRSNAEIPHYHVTQTIDLAMALAWLRTHNAALPVASRVLPAALFLRATVLAASAVPDLNGHWVDGALRPTERIDLGVAVATRGGGLVTPAIPDAGPLRIDDLMAALTDLVVRARRGNLRQAEMAGASITVSSLGETGPDALYGVIFPPQVALVGIGGIVERPWAVEGMLTVRPTVTVTLAADHRASDGRTASAFLATFAHALQNPEEL